MILKDEIEQKSKEQEITVANIQRDYLFGWLLNYLFTQSTLKDTLFLKGGNALRKAYFIKTRFSSDLDFGTPNDINHDFLKQEIKKACQFVSEKAGIVFVFDRNDVKEKFNWNEPRWKVFEVKIYFKDFYGNSDHITLKISLDITRFDKTYLDIQNRTLLHPYSDANDATCQIRCMQLEEILATKLKCLLQRDHAPDLFDFIYSLYLNPDISINKADIKRVFLKRTIFENSPNVAKNILLKLPFEYMKAVWLKTIICTQDIFFDFDDAFNKFVSEVEELFSGDTENPWRDRYFFEAETRNKIMRAGKEQTLLKVIYQGAERFVEPYSLKFQEKADGTAKEYLYVWNRNGGSSPKPGIRMFVPENLTSIENTEEKYTPQYEIELCRAGEYPEDRYLYDVNKKREKEYAKIYKIRQPRQIKTRTKSFGPTYVYKCSNCGKLSYRKTMDGALRPHKSKSGFMCYGYGIYQTTKF
ncbi:MAG: nucleotidyl transferase AbiEii/AbiGii toxin family protein [Candidatus Portnoybacteria bacterium]|nr:nucleotidyl transferase AbiEii/AbiGii toxin family protein [Candidatus Portnoybacteria bacterium]